MEYNLLIESVDGSIITNTDNFETKQLPELDKLNPEQIRVLHSAFQLSEFTKESAGEETLLACATGIRVNS